MSVAKPASTEAPRDGRTVPLRRGGLAAPAAAGVFVLILLLLIPAVSNSYWIGTFTSAVIYAAVAMSLGILVGRVGLISLCQVALLALGGWVALRLGYGTGLPFLLVMLLTGLITGVIGVIIGLPALRVGGLYFALITLMAAAAITLVLAVVNFPNGGHGFLGYSTSASGVAHLRRPRLAEGDTAYYRYATVVVVALFLLALAHLRSRVGRAWAAVRQSEPAALAAGISVTVHKLWAFALASFVTGVAGVLLAASGGGLTTQQFPVENSITLLAVVLIGGAYSLWGAVAAVVFMEILPALFQLWGVNNNLLLIIFGVGLLQALLTNPAGIVDQLPRDLRRLSGAVHARINRAVPNRAKP
jgi:branched-chain amino acid transport system permease protein